VTSPKLKLLKEIEKLLATLQSILPNFSVKSDYKLMLLYEHKLADVYAQARALLEYVPSIVGLNPSKVTMSVSEFSAQTIIETYNSHIGRVAILFNARAAHILVRDLVQEFKRELYRILEDYDVNPSEEELSSLWVYMYWDGNVLWFGPG